MLAQGAPGYPEPEKVHTLDPKIARTHTTFYADAGADRALVQVAKDEIKFDKTGYPDPDKVHVLAPELHQEFSNQ